MWLIWIVSSTGGENRSLLFQELADAIKYIQDDRNSTFSIRHIQVYISPEKKKRPIENPLGEPLSRSKDS